VILTGETVDLKRQLGVYTGVFIIVADMIGTGIFMTTGNLLGMTGNAVTVLVLWGIGGIVALTGSLCYAELATMWPDVGGEYVYLKKTFGPLPAFLTGWISLVVGFSAPVATSSLLVAQYFNRFMHGLAADPAAPQALDSLWAQKGVAACVVVFFALIHIVGVKKGGYFQNFLTVLKILLVVSFILFGFVMVDWSSAGRLTADYRPAGQEAVGIPVLGLALLIVMFAYSGWNGAVYIAGEIKNPERNLPRILFTGTLVTTALYLLLNVVFLLSSPGGDIMGKDEIGAIAGRSLFGPGVSAFFTLGIAVILLSAVSVQTMIGPRVYYAMAKDGLMFRSLASIHPRFETPALSIVIQMALALLYVFTGSAMTLVIYMGFALNIYPVLTVVGLIYLRKKHPGIRRPYRVPLYPLVPVLYITLTLAMMTAALMNWTTTSLFAIGVLALGVPVFYLWRRVVRK